MTAFADLETALNSAVIDGLANATATIGAVSVAGVFDNGYVDVYGTAQSAKVFTTSAVGIATLAQGQTLSIGGVSYSVAEIQPDGTGLSRVLLK